MVTEHRCGRLVGAPAHQDAGAEAQRLRDLAAPPEVPTAPETTTRDRNRGPADVGRYVNEELRERHFAACGAVYALAPASDAETDVETSFGSTHVCRFGPPDPQAASRTPVVLHGAGSDSSMWYPNLAALSAERPVFAVDTLGDPAAHGSLAGPTGAHRPGVAGDGHAQRACVPDPPAQPAAADRGRTAHHHSIG